MLKNIIILLLVIIIAFLLVIQNINIFINHSNTIKPETATELAKTITVLRPSFVDEKTIEGWLKNTGLAGYGKAFLEAEKQSGIGADYLVAIAFHESGKGTNTWWKYWNNCFSWGITDSGANSEAYYIKNNLSKSEAIVYIAKQIKALYLTEGGRYYSGETLAAINTYYATDKNWASAIINIHAQLVSSLPENIKAKQWIMGSKILKGNLPVPLYCTNDYWTKEITRDELAIILYRIHNSK